VIETSPADSGEDERDSEMNVKTRITHTCLESFCVFRIRCDSMFKNRGVRLKFDFPAPLAVCNQSIEIVVMLLVDGVAKLRLGPFDYACSRCTISVSR
jgi:hypothetical protein